MSKHRKMTAHVTTTVNQPPDSNLETKVMHKIVAVIKQAKKEKISRPSQYGEALERSLAQYTHIPNNDSVKVINTLILYKTTNNETLPRHHNKIASANPPNKNKPF